MPGSDTVGCERAQQSDVAGPGAIRFAAAAWPYLLVLAAGLFVLLPGLGDYGFWDPWEPKYAESAREMKELGSYVVPYYRYEVRLAKPILVYWGVLAGGAVFGLDEFGARFAGVTMALLALCAVYYVVSTLRGRQAGILCALVLASCPQFYFLSRQAMPDVYLFTSLGASLLFFALGLFGPTKRRNLHFAASYACFALAVLAKGPLVAGTVAFGTLAVYTFTRFDLHELWRSVTRRETLRFVVACLTGVLSFTVFGLLALLLGTSQQWWGYNDEQQQAIEQLQQRLTTVLGRLHLGEILLAALGIAALLGAVQLWRRRAEVPPGRTRLAVTGSSIALAAATLVALAGQALHVERRLALAALLIAAGGAMLVVASTGRLVRRAGIGSALRPYLRPIVLQLALFAIVFLVVAGPWHAAILLKERHGYVSDFLVKHNITRATDSINSGGSADYYLHTLVWGYFPWSAFIPLALALLVPWWKRDALRRAGFEVFLLISVAITFAAFSISMTKFAHYLSPMLLPLATLIGLTVARTLERPHAPPSRLAWLVATTLFLLPATNLMDNNGVRNLLDAFTPKRWVPDELEPGSYVAALLAAAAVCMLLSVLVRSRLLVAGLVATSLLFANHYTGTIIPGVSRHKSMKGLTDTWRELREPGDEIGFRGDLKHGIFFYTDFEVWRMGGNQAFLDFMSPERQAFCIVERDKLDRLRTSYRESYPDHALYLVDDSHFDYHLVANFPALERRAGPASVRP